ncbi:MAG: tetratricopeptide repeat protein [Bryobacteraceae bacterium]|nr:tetratricopeptide repeat protein [Bryobacterales bacterium]MEB2362857.1 tetratricopeptide repeat protein [Bryobacterales bacterium]NUN00168.1 tetratricopeptide repeat protein [Bryobacteraceae bacterium]
MRGWIPRIALIFLAPVAAFVLLEAVLRISDYGFATQFFVQAAQPGEYTTNQRFGERFFPKALARTPIPTLLSKQKDPGTYRIFVLGESAAMGIPEPAYSFGRVLEVMLREIYAGARFEVVNAAMTAINSHAILPIARDCASFQPDLFVALIGNNEVVGPFGPGTVFGTMPPVLWLVRVNVWQTSTRTGQLFRNVLAKFRKQSEPVEWRGMEMFLDKQVAWDAAALHGVYGNFRRNLEDIAQTAERAGAAVLFSTVPSNLKDSPPFASTQPDNERWQELYRRGVELETAEQWSDALTAYRQAAALDGESAELHFRIGRCHLALNQTGAARDAYIAARDRDLLRFRADSVLNGIIRKLRGTRVYVVDAETEFGLAGHERFYEHVHLNERGNYELARLIAQRFDSVAPPWIKRKGSMPSMEAVAAQLALTDWDRYKLARQMKAMMDRPPFTNQTGSAQARSKREKALYRMEENARTAGAMEHARRSYENALAKRPADLLLHVRWAEFLRDERQYGRAAEEWRILNSRLPGIANWLAAHAAVLADAGRIEEAVSQYRQALRVDPASDVALFGLGSAFAAKGDYQEAALQYGEALRINPRYAEVHNNLGLIHLARGDLERAKASFASAVKYQPDFAAAHYNLGGVLMQQGKAEEAARQYRIAVSQRPQFAEAHYNLGLLASRAGRLKEALAHYADAIRLKPDYPEAHNNMGTAFAREGDMKRAVHHFSEAIRLRPDYTPARQNLSKALQSARRR